MGHNHLRANLVFKELSGPPFGTAFQNGTDLRFPHCHGLDDDCAIGVWSARADVTNALWKSTIPLAKSS